ncbi:DNA polymerase III subunit gamma/tau [Hyphococcus flavus]|uniref:DNA polymerase III subunit gamma/tau n=1 Tax=Hyphococcus flavus TaxID=1866326 RepID=A0AAE9ZDA7_9PROT|nr:DNA polymerase III subunit gamma/tau [Hyphococcus flavus]WDI32844.1 DNA polymerase III subunit gamma/tau [Hyphococcus flavus]
MAETETSDGKDDAAPYQVLARKYRPQNFDDLIGHGPMVRTLKNAFASDRIAHAYILTGVRGVGKTTTARILARALNYVGPNGEDNGPQMDLKQEGRHCRAIAESRHPDVMEMDAASRTGVGDIRELIEGVRYAPVEARYKVYIIDEVHMLSTAAFNALLKTLEEPPPHVKFIFATTEIRKLPVTVLSRCQRFDLRRIDPEMLTDHLSNIAEKEKVNIDRDGLWMIARAAEGSVRDALSILDQAIVQHGKKDGEAVTADEIREMLGLADRSSVWALLDAAMKGDAKEALTGFRAQYDAGAEPAQIIRDMLDLTHLLTRIKAAGPEAASHGPAGEADAERAKNMADALEMNALTRSWSLLMKGLSETQIAPDAAAAGEMALIRLCFAADLPTPDEALRALKKNSDDGVGADNAPAPKRGKASSPAPAEAVYNPPADGKEPAKIIDIKPPLSQRPKDRAPWLRAFDDVVKLAGKMRDAKLRTELESYVHLVSFREGRIELRLHDDAPGDLANRLAVRLKEWTGRQWIVTVTSESKGAETLRDARTREVMEHPMVTRALELFPGAEVTAIREPETVAEPAPDETEEDAPVDPDDDAVAEAIRKRTETGKP